MTQEEKQLLLRDLCARLSYNVVMTNKTLHETTYILRGADLDEAEFDNDWDDVPYLRPMSSMTEEEQKEFESIWDNGFGKALDAQISNFDDCVIRNLEITASSNAVDWLNKHGFDYRGLIPKDLAISTEEFNPYKD